MCLEWGAWKTFFRQGSALLSNATLCLCLAICLAASLSRSLSLSVSLRFSIHTSFVAAREPSQLRRSSQFQQKLLSWHLKLICKLGLDQFRAVGALLWHWHRPQIMLSCWLHRARKKNKKTLKHVPTVQWSPKTLMFWLSRMLLFILGLKAYRSGNVFIVIISSSSRHSIIIAIAFPSLSTESLADRWNHSISVIV